MSFAGHWSATNGKQTAVYGGVYPAGLKTRTSYYCCTAVPLIYTRTESFSVLDSCRYILKNDGFTSTNAFCQLLKPTAAFRSSDHQNYFLSSPLHQTTTSSKPRIFSTSNLHNTSTAGSQHNQRPATATAGGEDGDRGTLCESAHRVRQPALPQDTKNGAVKIHVIEIYVSPVHL